ncbi:YbaB/EbfC family nucleoid-associated protein [Micromonospora ureilytica]|uniref:YbaB/EbfC family nucleoid-associated protein n=1 Tax=Micromonospora ureilytica TaxID=709868 RepID=UPI0030B8A5FB
MGPPVAFVRLLRQSGGNNATRLLVLPTLNTNSNQAQLDALATTISQLGDKNIAATVHFYGWWPFSVNIAGGTRYDANVEQDMVDGFDRVHNTFVAKGIPVIVGEWALLSYDYTRPGIIERGELLKFFEAVGYHARIRKLTTMLWDAGSFLNRNDLQWRDPGLYALMKASWTTRSATASSDQIYVPRTGTITSKALTLNLNGASFRSLRQGSTVLTIGTDYTVSGTTLTLTSAGLTRLVGNRAPGVNANLEAHFSQGVPWPISIISYDPPTQAGATGTTSSFTIPTQFRGDQLATMEAKYADGSPAGPANWTSYKEFWSNFQPDYAANTILLKPEFFAEVNDGSTVTLTFHFWSGTQITYRVTRSGTSVTGRSPGCRAAARLLLSSPHDAPELSPPAATLTPLNPLLGNRNGGAMGNPLLDAEDARERLEAWQANASRRAADTQAASAGLRALRVTASDAHGIVEVTVDSTGAMADVRLSARAQRVSLEQTQQAIMGAYRNARVKLAEAAAEVVRETVGADSATGRALLAGFRTADTEDEEGRY